jgi:DNA-binding winged helix-turn-helix (wHTH) protein/tetratricopeptide (TPR) repeat protein
MSLNLSHLEFGPYILDVSNRELRRGDAPVPLSAKVFDLLFYMAQNPGRPLLKKELLDAVWPNSFVEESNLSQNIFVLRRALGPDGGGYIETLPGRGYRFKALVRDPAPQPPVPPIAALVETTETRVVYEEETYEEIREESREELPPPVPVWRSPLVLTLSLAVLVLLAVSAWFGWQRWQDHLGGSPVQVVLSDIDGGTGDAVLDRTLNDVLRIEMAQSPFVTVVSIGTVRRTLTQMLRKPDDPITLAVAREICERTGSQAVLHAQVARAGKEYVLTEEATNCVDGATLVQAKDEISRVEELPHAVETLGTRIRHGLGESRRTIARFNAPLVPVSTTSLDALKAYSQGGLAGQRAHFGEATELLKEAVRLDPQFAAAYLDLSIYASNSIDPVNDRAYLQKAYDLREFANEPTRLYIVARYHVDITGDVDESVRNYQAWIALYPRSPQAWSGLSNTYRLPGRHAEELVAARHTVELLPGNASVYPALASAQMQTGDPAAARTTCTLALSRNMDGDFLRTVLLRVGYLQHDSALVDTQLAWLKQHPEAFSTQVNAAIYAQAEGRINDTLPQLDLMDEGFRRWGSPQAATRLFQSLANNELDLGYPDLARKHLHLAPVAKNEFNQLLTLAGLGDSAGTAALLKQQLDTHSQSTLWNRWYGPLVRGKLAMLAGKPQDAIALLEPTRQFDGKDLDGYFLRGQAFLQASQLPQAETEFRQLIAHPYIDPNTYQIPLARLFLARILAREGRDAEAMDSYRQVLAFWSHADADFPPMLEAKRELVLLEKRLVP